LILPHNNIRGAIRKVDIRPLKKNTITNIANKPNEYTVTCIPIAGFIGIIISPINIRAIKIPNM